MAKDKKEEHNSDTRGQVVVEVGEVVSNPRLTLDQIKVLLEEVRGLQQSLEGNSYSKESFKDLENRYPVLLRELAKKNYVGPITKEERVDYFVTIFKALGELYQYKAQNTKEIKDLTDATIFYQYVLAISERQEESFVAAKLVDLQSQLLVITGIHTEAKIPLPYEEAQHNKNFLEELRKDTLKEIERIDIDYDASKIEGRAEKHLKEEAHISSIRALYEQIADRIKFFISRLVQECQDIIGVPPCAYTVIGLGSLALKQFTPYSDLEFAILTENAEYSKSSDLKVKNYFLNLAHLLHFKIINLGESIIPNSKYHVNLEHLVHRGINFDLGGKTPLGRIDGDKPYSLIQTVEGMLRYLKNEDNNSEHIDKILPYIVEATTYIYGDKSLLEGQLQGEIKVKKGYQDLVVEFLKETNVDGVPNYKTRSLKRLKEGVVEYDYSDTREVLRTHHIKGNLEIFAPKLASQGDEGRLFDVKQEIYRLPDRLLYDLSTYFGIVPESAWDGIMQLKSSGVFTQSNSAYNLLRAVTYATELRLRIYSYYKEQNDEMTVLVDTGTSTSGNRAIFRLKLEELGEEGRLCQYYYTSIQLQTVLQKAFDSKEDNLVHLIGDESYYKDDAKTKGLLNIRLLRYGTAIEKLSEALDINPDDNEVAIVLGTTLRKMGRHQDAMEHSEKLLAKLTHAQIVDNSAVETVYGNLAILYGIKENYKKSLNYLNKILEILEVRYGKDPHPALETTLNNIGVVYETMGQIKEAADYYKRAVACHKKNNDTEDNLSLAITLFNLAKVSTYNLGVSQENSRYTKVLSYYKESLEILEKIYGSGVHPAVALVANSMTEIYTKQGKFEEALSLLFKTLEMRKIVYGDIDHIDTAMTLHNIGSIYLSSRQPNKALIHLKQALDMKKRIFRDEVSMEVAKTSINVGNVYMQLKKFQESLEYFQTAAEIYEKVNAAHPHPETAAVFLNMAVAFHELDQLYKAQKSIDRAMTIINQCGDHVFKRNIYGFFGANLRKILQQDAISQNILKQLFVLNDNKDITNYHLQVALASTVYDSGQYEDALIYQRLAQYFAEHSEVPTKPKDIISILHNLGCFYHTCSIAHDKSSSTYCLYIAKADASFKRALSFQESELNTGLFTEYANFLLEQNRYAEALVYLQQAIASGDCESKLSYGEIEKGGVSQLLQQAIDTSESKAIEVVALHYAYYLLISNYDKFIEAKVEGLEDKETYIALFGSIVPSAEEMNDISRAMLQEILSTQAQSSSEVPQTLQVSNSEEQDVAEEWDNALSLGNIALSREDIERFESSIARLKREVEYREEDIKLLLPKAKVIKEESVIDVLKDLESKIIRQQKQTIENTQSHHEQLEEKEGVELYESQDLADEASASVTQGDHLEDVAIVFSRNTEKDIEQWVSIFVHYALRDNIAELWLTYQDPNGERMKDGMYQYFLDIRNSLSKYKIKVQIQDIQSAQQLRVIDSGPLVVSNIGKLQKLYDKLDKPKTLVSKEELVESCFSPREGADKSIKLLRLKHQETLYGQFIGELVIENNLHKLSEIFKALGDNYHERGQVDNNPEYLTEAAKYYQYMISISDKEVATDKIFYERSKVDAQNQLQLLKEELIKVVGGDIAQSRCIDISHEIAADKFILEELRDRSKLRLEEIELYLETAENILPEEEKARDKVFIERSRDLFSDITIEMKSFLGNLYKDAQAILGDQPCDYTVIGLGSMALQQITPYSDLEFAILTKNEDYKTNHDSKIRNYFTHLTHLVHFRVINLGESIIPTSRYNVDLSKFLKVGVNFDLGGKTPLGRIDKPYSLIQTPEKMVRYLEDKFFHVDKHLSSIVETCTSVYEYVHKEDEDHKRLVDDYREKVSIFLNNKNSDGIPNYETRAIKRLREESIEYDYLGNGKFGKHQGNIKVYEPQLTGQENEGKPFNAKQEVYRLVDRLLYDLAIYYGIAPQSIWNAVDGLREKQIIATTDKTEHAQNNLLYAASFATTLRLRTYQHYGQQRDDIEVLSLERVDSLRTVEVFHLSAKELEDGGALFKYYYVALSLHKKLEEFCNLKDRSLVKGFFVDELFYSTEDKTKGDIYLKLLQYEKAVKYLQKHLMSQEQIYDSNGLEIAGILIDIGNAYGNLGGTLNLQEQIKLQKRALDIYEVIYGPNHHEVARTLVNLGNAYENLGGTLNLQEQIKLQTRALRINEMVYGHDHPEVASALMHLGNAYGNLGGMLNLHEQIRLQKRALHIDELAYGPNHLEVARILTNLGNAYGDLGGKANLQKKIKLQTRAVDIKETAYGLNHPQVALTLTLLGNAYGRLGEWSNLQEKIKLEKRALNIYETTYSHNHPEVARTLVNLGNAYGDLGGEENLQEQIKLQKRALDICEAEYSAEHLEVARVLTNLGNAYGRLGDELNLQKQISLQKRALDIYETAYGSSHTEIAATLNDLGNAYGHLGGIGNVQQQISMQKRALEIFETVCDKNHPHVATTLTNLGNAYGDLGGEENLQEKITLQERALAIYKEAYGTNHPEIAKVLLNLGNAFKGLKRYKEAIELQENALRMLKADNDVHVDKAIYIIVRNLSEFAHEFSLSPERCIAIFNFCTSNGLRFVDYDVLQGAASSFLNSGMLDEAVEVHKIAIIFANQDKHCDIKTKQEIYHNLGCTYNVLAVRSHNEKDQNSIEYYSKAQEAFKRAVEYSKDTEDKAGLYVEYANFLLGRNCYEEAFFYLQRAIELQDDESELNYGAVEKETISSILQQAIDSTEDTTVEVIALHYAYYLLISNYNKFIEEKVEGLETKEVYIALFDSIVSSTEEVSQVSRIMLAAGVSDGGESPESVVIATHNQNTQEPIFIGKVEIVYDNPILNHKYSSAILTRAYQVGGMELVNRFMCLDHAMAHIIISAIEARGINGLFNNEPYERSIQNSDILTTLSNEVGIIHKNRQSFKEGKTTERATRFDLYLKSWVYSREIKQLKQLLRDRDIQMSWQESLSGNNYRKISSKLHPDTGGRKEEFQFYNDFRKKFNEQDIELVIQELQFYVHKTAHQLSVTFKALDIGVDVVRTYYKPTMHNIAHTMISGAYLLSMTTGITKVSAAANILSVSYIYYENGIYEAIKSAVTLGIFTAAPYALILTSVPYIGLAYTVTLTAYTSVNLVNNIWLLYQELTSKDALFESTQAYQEMYQKVSDLINVTWFSNRATDNDVVFESIKQELQVQDLNSSLDREEISVASETWDFIR